MIIDYPAGELFGIAVDASDIYFSDRFNASILRASRQGGPTTLIGSTSHSQSLDVAVDDDCVYWTVLDASPPTTMGVSHVYAAPKPK